MNNDEILQADYNSMLIRVMKLPGNGLLLNTKDVCQVLDITHRPAGSELASPCLDIASAVKIASSCDDDDFAMWVSEAFFGYALETLVHPRVDDDWNVL